MSELRSLARVYVLSAVAGAAVLAVIYVGAFPALENAFQQCWKTYDPRTRIGGAIDAVIQRHRGSNYWMAPPNVDESKLPKHCVATSWSVSHIVLYALLGYWFPKRFWLTFIVGVLYEVLEWRLVRAHDALDIVWNSIGFFIGSAMASL